MLIAPVLYLDLDHTLIAWRDGSPRAAPAAREFIIWALEHFEVRWLTTWCPDGEMGESLLQDLARMVQLPADRLRAVRGLDWQTTDCKLNGIAWLEHLVLGRPFVWVEDNYGVGQRELDVLAAQEVLHCYHKVNVTEDPDSLARLLDALRLEWCARPRD